MNIKSLFNFWKVCKIFQSNFATQYKWYIVYSLNNPCGEGEKCASPYSFKNHLPLTNNSENFVKQVRAAEVSGNLDSPEGGLDAMMQAMVCKDIQWREQARHLLVYSSGRYLGLFPVINVLDTI